MLDTSALLALRGDEPGADRIETLLTRAKNGQTRLLICFMSRMEILYIVWREEGEISARDALRLIDSFTVEWVSCEARLLEIASSLKATGGLSIADSWIGATAIARDATLVHKDPEFSKFTAISQEMLRN